MNDMKIRATFQQEVYVDPVEAFKQIKTRLGFAPYRSFITIKDGELVQGEDASYHGSPMYEYETISNNPRMFLISSAITKAFHGENAAHSRFLQEDGQEDTGGSIFHLSTAEQKTLIGALVEQRERQESAMTQTEQLLRRMTGSITAYMDVVGQRPLHMNDYDRAVLTIRDGELEAFKTLLPDLRDRAEALFIQAAGRPGTMGRKMTMLMLDNHYTLPLATYRLACKKTIDTGDTVKVDFLLDQAPTHVEKLPLVFYGELAYYAYSYHGNITNHIIDRCTPEQVEQFPGKLLHDAILRSDLTTPWKLVQKGINGDKCIVDIIDFCARTRKEGKVRQLLQDGLKISAGNFPALWACIQHRFTDCAKLLLENGMDFDAFKQWASERHIDLVQSKSYRQIEYFDTVRNNQQDSGMQMS